MGYDHLAVKVAVIEGSTYVQRSSFQVFFKRIKQRSLHHSLGVYYVYDGKGKSNSHCLRVFCTRHHLMVKNHGNGNTRDALLIGI